MSERSAANEGSCPSACSAFHRWWQDKGIAETIDIEDAALVRRIRALCKIAWSNGEYKARESEMQNEEGHADRKHENRTHRSAAVLRPLNLIVGNLEVTSEAIFSR